jgi:hypothetical protein
MTPVQAASLSTSLLVASTFGALAATGGMAPAAALAVWALGGSLTIALCAL